ncbi:MAG TPA: glutamine-hydrolyzing carbamoyl-phosphate synthase small subunit [Anaerolineae bacterium]|nr:glutamine-hydrolyzing carbamoyl-phosphate synthase small subunit [Anaerolineae bacterium]
MSLSSYPPAILALADGTIFRGQSFGAPVTITGEIVFNTSMTGYQEILTDPSYYGQIVTMTCPHIGNVGVNPEDVEARRPWASGLIVREVSRRVSNWRATQSLPDYLRQHNLPGLTGLDTRALVRHIRSQGAMMAALSGDERLSPADLIDLARAAPPMDGLDLAKEVTCPEPYHWGEDIPSEWKPEIIRNTYHVPRTTYHVVAYDFGIKHNILRLLTDAGCRITVVPATTPAKDVLAMAPDGIFLSNGPGDPAAVTYAIEATRELIESDLPIFGICLGHQILGLAFGGITHKLKFGHRGGNQPVKEVAALQPSNLPTLQSSNPPELEGGVSITSHNHGFAVTAGSLPDEVEITHLNLNDDCIEGLRHKTKPVFSIQYHPEASPGPHDAILFFRQFVELMEQRR